MDSLKSFVSNYCSGFEPGLLFAASTASRKFRLVRYSLPDHFNKRPFHNKTFFIGHSSSVYEGSLCCWHTQLQIVATLSIVLIHILY